MSFKTLYSGVNSSAEIKPMTYPKLNSKLYFLVLLVAFLNSCQKDELPYNDDIEVVLDETITEASKNKSDEINAWLLIALNHYKTTYESSKYQSLSADLENWLRSMQNADGSISGGINTDGSLIPKVTEGILMAFNAVEGYDDFHKGILKFLNNNRWNTNLGLFISWPENPKYNYALDLHPLGCYLVRRYRSNGCGF